MIWYGAKQNINIFSVFVPVFFMHNQIAYWIKSAKHDLDVAETLFQNGKYDWCLYIAHLVLEKTLKAFYDFNNNK